MAILGKVPPPYMGPAIATKIILESELSQVYDLIHVNTAADKSLDAIGKVSSSKLFTYVSVYASLLQKIITNRPDLVLIPISQTTLGFVKDSIFVLICSLFSDKVLLQLRGSGFRSWVEQASKPTRAYVTSVLSRADGVIVLGSNLRYLFENFFPAERIFVARNGANYDVKAFRDTSTESLSDSQAGVEAPVNLLYLANLQPTKGIQDIIDAVSLLQKKGVQGFQLDVVGKWRDEVTQAYCEKVVQEEGLPVVFHGPKYNADKFHFFARADIFLFTPRAPEGHPWVMVESLAFSLPVIATDQGAIIESVIDGENGFVVKSNNPADIAEKLQRLIEDPSLRENMSKKSRQHYENHFTEERMVEGLSRTFDYLINTPPR